MKNQEILHLISKKALAVVLSTSLAVVSLSGCSKSDIPEEVVEKTSEEVLEEALTEHAGVHTETESGEMTKSETVYVLADANGKTNEVIVSDWIKNPKAETGLNDVSSLSNIENTTGSEIFTEDTDGNLHWAANGNDIHYQGTSDKDLPVDVSVTYYLEGEEISPSELAVKSGNIRIRFDYANNEKVNVTIDGKEEEIYVPFAMVSGLILPTEKFSNIKVTNGRVETEGDKNIVLGMAFPGLSESLDMDSIKDKAESGDAAEDINDFEIPEYVEISAYTTDFEMDQTMTVAVSDVLSALDSTSSKINTDNIKNSLGELDDASNQLSEGTVTLSDGAKELMNGAKTLSEKSVELDDGARQLDEGAMELFDGATELSDGAKKLDDGVATLTDGTVTLKDGTESLVAGVGNLKDGTVKLKDGTKQLREGYEGADGALAGASKLASGASQLNDAVRNSEIPTLTEEQKEQIEKAGYEGAAGQAETFAGSIADGVATQISGSIEAKREAAVQSAKEVAAQKAEETAAMVEAQFQASFDANQGEPYENAVAASNQFASGVGSALESALSGAETEQAVEEGISEGMEQAIDAAIQTYCQQTGATYIGSAAEAIASGVASQASGQVASGVLSGLAGAISIDGSAFLAGVEQLMLGTAGSVATATSVEAAGETAGTVVDMISASVASDDTIATIRAGLTESLADGLGQLGSAVALKTAESLMTEVGAKLKETMTTLGDATQQLADGTSLLSNGVVQLYYGTYQVDEGMATLNSGVDELQDGAYRLDNGACALRNGAVELKDGTSRLYDGTLTLKSGTVELKSGTSELYNGTTQFVDGTSTLYSGTKELSDGSIELMEGMLKFDEEGIKKLTNMFGEDVDSVIDRFKTVINAGDSYKIFTDVPDGVDSSVKLIYKTEAIKNDK